jgi:hypothetical protein
VEETELRTKPEEEALVQAVVRAVMDVTGKSGDVNVTFGKPGIHIHIYLKENTGASGDAPEVGGDPPALPTPEGRRWAREKSTPEVLGKALQEIEEKGRVKLGDRIREYKERRAALEPKP